MIWLFVLLLICLLLCLWQIKVLSVKAEAAKRAEQTKQAVLQNLSHEIRTPLQTVSGLAGVIADETLYLSKGEKRNISDQIKFNTGLISTLLDEVLLIANGSKGHNLVDEEFSPNTLCHRCMDAMLNQRDGEDGPKVLFKRELSDEFFVRADAHMVELILSKLLECARRFTSKGEIVVGCNTKDTPGLLSIYVQDTGQGIPEDRKQTMFDWLEHPDEATDDVEITLSVASRLAKRLGGVLKLDPTYQGGTRMLLVLPVR